MASNLFTITTPTSRVRLDKDRRGEASFTVSNASGRTIDGRALLVAEDEAVKAWLSLVGEEEREFAEAETHQYTVEVAAPPEAPAGDYDIGLDMVETENPDENYTKGPTVTVEVPEPEPEPEEPGWPFPFPWWYIVVGVLVVVAVIVALVLLLRPKGPRIAYVYGSDQATAESYQALLEENRFVVDLVPQGKVPSTDFASYDCILVGPRTGSGANWGDVAGNQARRIANSGRPVLGLGEGGYAFFGRLGLDIGWGKGWHGTGSDVFVVDTGSPVWSSPNRISVPGNQIVVLYAGGTNYVAIHSPSPPGSVTHIGRQSDDATHYQIIEQHGRALLWGFDGSPSIMTPTGRKVFINTVNSLLP